MVMMPVHSLKDFLGLLERDLTYPFYGVMLYTPLNHMDARMHEYVQSRWDLLNGLTGDSCLLLAIEDVDRPRIEDFKPEDVYEIARHLGAHVDDLPRIVMFTEPKTRADTIVLRLGEFLPSPEELTDDHSTDFFRGMQTIIDSCAGKDRDRLKCLMEGLDHDWPSESQWGRGLPRLGVGWLRLLCWVPV